MMCSPLKDVKPKWLWVLKLLFPSLTFRTFLGLARGNEGKEECFKMTRDFFKKSSLAEMNKKDIKRKQKRLKKKRKCLY